MLCQSSSHPIHNALNLPQLFATNCTFTENTFAKLNRSLFDDNWKADVEWDDKAKYDRRNVTRVHLIRLQSIYKPLILCIRGGGRQTCGKRRTTGKFDFSLLFTRGAEINYVSKFHEE